VIGRRWTITGSGGHIATEERWELLAEVRAGEDRERVQALLIEAVTAQLAYQKSYSQLLYRQLEKSHGEGDDLRAQLALWDATRTTGGLRRPYSGANWTANLIDQGALPKGMKT
jgi:hypothetical protein